MRPRTLKEVADRFRLDPDWDLHLRNFLDAFYACHGDHDAQAAALADDPGRTGDDRVDAFLGGTGEHLARRWRLPIPAWVRQDFHYLGSPMFVPDEDAVRGYLLGASPASFRARLIFVGSDPLQRARFPYDEGTRTLPHDFPPRSGLAAECGLP